MDIAALVTAIVLAKLSAARQVTKTVSINSDGTAAMGGPVSSSSDEATDGTAGMVKDILVDTLRSPAISALVAGLCLGILAEPDSVYKSFYEPLFRGLLSILMLIMGMEAWSRFAELRKVAHAYVLYGLTAPTINGLMGFGVGLVAHHLTGFSEGGVILLAVMAASSSDISGPPTMRAALPDANSSAYGRNGPLLAGATRPASWTCCNRSNGREEPIFDCSFCLSQSEMPYTSAIRANKFLWYRCSFRAEISGKIDCHGLIA